MIQLQEFSKEYGKKIAVSNASFVCENNSVTGLLGPNGAGKTTILKAICGVHLPTSGNIFVNGCSVEEDTINVQKQIGYVSEQPMFPNQYAVSEYLFEIGNIRFPKEKKAQIKTAVESVINACSLEEVISSKIGVLSKGYKQRLSFAQALIHNPNTLILDEPVSGLDPVQIVEMRKLIKELSKTKTILLSTHLMQEATQLCSSVVIIYNGNVIAADSEKAICKTTKTSNLEEAFVVLASQEKGRI